MEQFICLIAYNITMTTTTEKIELEKDFSYEVRVYCDRCNEEVDQYSQQEHINECEYRK